MPYIKNEEREEINKAVVGLANMITKGDRYAGDPLERAYWIDGRTNYAISMLLGYLYHYPPSLVIDDPKTPLRNRYGNYERAMGLLSCIQQEFYRRKVAEYENLKIDENGDLER